METVEKILREIGNEVSAVAVVVLRSALTFAVAWAVSRFARRYLEPRLQRRKLGRDGAILIGRLIAILAYVFAFVSVMSQLGVDWSGLLTLLSAFTVAIGLSLQDVIKNFFSGILMLLERPFSVGDRVKVRDYEGEIQGIDVRTTLIRNSDGALVYVPNSIMFGEILTNRSHFRTRRLRITVTDPARSVEEIEPIVVAALGTLSTVRKPVSPPRIMSLSPEGVTLRYGLLIATSDDAEHDVVSRLGEVLRGAKIEVDV